MFQSNSHHIVMRRRRPGNGFECVWAYKNSTLHDFWVRANLGVYGRVTGQGVSRTRACHGPGFGPGLVLVWSRFLFWCWFGPGLVPVWSRFDTGLVPVWSYSRFGPGLVPVWSGFDTGLVLVWSRFGPGVVPTRACHGPGRVTGQGV